MFTKKRDTILWLTGWSMPSTVFDQLHHYLPDFHHVSVDYSASSSPDEMLQMTEKAARGMLSKKSGSFLIGGWSLGGLLAIRLAIQGLADGLILFSATAKFTRPRDQMELGWNDIYVRQMIKGIEKDRHLTEAKFRQKAFANIECADFSSSGNWSNQALIAGLEVLRSVDCLDQLSNINIPVFIVHGREDIVCPYKAAEELKSLLPNANMLSFPNSGHAPFLEREAYLAESIRSWWHEQ